MAETPSVTTLELQLPIYTEVLGARYELGTTTIDVPVRIRVSAEPEPVDLRAAAIALLEQVAADQEHSGYWKSRESHTNDLTLTRQYLESILDSHPATGTHA